MGQGSETISSEPWMTYVLTPFKSRYMHTPFVEELHQGAKIMLAYFHYCNKGAHPFSLDWTVADNIAMAELNAEQVQFVKETAELVKAKSTHFSRP